MEDGSGRRRLGYQAGQVVSDLYETGPLTGFGHGLSLDSANGYRPSGRSILSPSGTLRSESLAYDGFGRMDALTVDDDTVAYGFHHDTAFPTSTTVSRDGTASVSQTRAYDRLGRLDSIDASDGTAILFSAAQTFGPHGRVDRITLDGGAYWDYGYDAMGQVTSGVKKDSVGTALPGYNFGYGFDSIGNRESATREATTEAYTPNFLNQITEIDHGGLLHLLGTADASASVLVDGAAATRSGDLFYGTIGGNNTFENFSILGTLTGAGDGGSDAVARFDREAYIPAGATSRTHDESGNLTGDAEWLYTWDAENRLVRMETRPFVVTAGAPPRRLTFEYDSQSRRTRKTVETWDGTAWQTDEDIRFLWNDWLLSAELEADTLEPIRSYTWGHDFAGTREQTGGVGGLALVKHHKNGEVSVPLYTTNGNVRGYWEIDGEEIVAEFEYGPFGELLKTTGAKANKHPIRWSSKYEDAETGLVYYGYRFFDPETGRWSNRDPIEERGGSNIYAFIENEALRGFDILGEARTTDGVSTGGDLNAPWAEEGWALPGGGGFAGPGYAGRFGDRPVNVFGFNSKLHDGAYQYNGLSFSFGGEREPLIRSKMAKTDYICRKMNELSSHGPVAWLWSQASKIVFYDNPKYFCAGDDFTNVLPLPNWDNDNHLMIPYFELPRDQRPYIRERIPGTGFSNKPGGVRYRRVIILNQRRPADDENGGWRGWARRYFGNTWSRASSINDQTDSSFQW